MFEKLITNLKNSLSSKKKAQAELDAEESGDANEQQDELEPQNEESSSTETSSDDAAAKKRSMIIKVVVVLALVYLAVDQFILKEDPAPETVAAPMPRKKKNRPMPSATPAAEATPVVAATPTPDATPTPEATPTTTPIAETTPTPAVEVTPVQTADTSAPTEPAPVETVNVVNKETTSPPAPEVVQPPVEASPMQTNVGETKQVEKQIDKEIDKLIEGENKKDDSISAKIVEKVEADAGVTDVTYVEPPTYEINGRGLVYNCKEKFWVCVDKTSFLQCTKNMKANKAMKKPAECAIASVYATNEDCALVQKHNVSINAPTDFCNN